MSGSIQLQRYLAARATGATMMTAAAQSGISIAEARLTENDIARGDLVLPPARPEPEPAPEPATPPPGHNNPPEETTMSTGTVAADELRLLIERIERLSEEKQAIADDIKDVYAEAKARGYDARTMREIVKLRKLDKNERDEREALLETYKAALGLYSDTPLGQAALRAVA